MSQTPRGLPKPENGYQPRPWIDGFRPTGFKGTGRIRARTIHGRTVQLWEHRNPDGCTVWTKQPVRE